MKYVMVLAMMLWGHSLWAACSGVSPNLSAPTWADVTACHTAATSGDTITVTAGTYTVTAETDITKYVHIVMGGTVNLTDNSCTGDCTTSMISISEATAGSTKLQGPLYITKGSGYHTGSGGIIGIENVTGGKPVLVTDVHYTLTGSGNFFNVHTNRGVLWANSATGSVAESAQCLNNASFLRHKYTGGGIANWETPLAIGSADTNGDQNLYVENNTLDKVLEGLDTDDDGRTVFRYNTVINSGGGTHGVDTSGIMGARFIDYDHNTFVRDLTEYGGACGGLAVNMNGFIALRGGTALIHDNVIPDINDGYWGNKGEISFWVEELRRNQGGYPCWSGGYPAPHNTGWGWTVGGSSYPLAGGGTGTQDIEPIYIWNNTGTGNYTAPNVNDFEPDQCGANLSAVDYVVVNRDYYLATAKPNYTAYTYPHPLTVTTAATFQLEIRRNVLQSATATTARLDVGASALNGYYSRSGTSIAIVSGTGNEQFRPIIGYNGTTKDVTINLPWVTTPPDGSPYVLIPTTGGLVLRTGTAVSAGASSITFEASASGIDGYYSRPGTGVLITGGTGAGQVRTIVRYTGATRTATVNVPWTVGAVPDATSTYSLFPRER